VIEDDFKFSCPYCDASQLIRFDISGGAKQQFVSDCEVCCQPILIRVEFDSESLVSFSAEQEND